MIKIVGLRHQRRLTRIILTASTLMATALMVNVVTPPAQAASPADAGIQEYNAGKFKSALDKLQAEAKKNPSDPTVHYYLGLCYQYLCKRDEAKKEFTWVSTASHKAKAEFRADAQKRLTALSKPVGKDGAIGCGTKPVVMEFGATWCVPCRAFAPIFDKVKDEYKGKIDFEKVDIDDESKSNLVSKYHIESVPTLVMLDKTGKTAYTSSGALEEKAFVEQVKKLAQ